MRNIYTFPLARNPYYPTFYASEEEIWNYFRRTTEEYHLYKNIPLDTKVLDSCWDESSKKWKITIEQEKMVREVEADVFINASGIPQ